MFVDRHNVLLEMQLFHHFKARIDAMFVNEIISYWERNYFIIFRRA